MRLFSFLLLLLLSLPASAQQRHGDGLDDLLQHAPMAAVFVLKGCALDNDTDWPDSGHSTFAFAGATMLCHEFGHVSPWVPIGGYGVATLTAIDRLVRDRHYLHDVCAGAAIGVAATELTYFLKKKLLKSKNVDLSFSGQTFDLAIRW